MKKRTAKKLVVSTQSLEDVAELALEGLVVGGNGEGGGDEVPPEVGVKTSDKQQ